MDIYIYIYISSAHSILNFALALNIGNARVDTKHLTNTTTNPNDPNIRVYLHDTSHSHMDAKWEYGYDIRTEQQLYRRANYIMFAHMPSRGYLWVVLVAEHECIAVYILYGKVAPVRKNMSFRSKRLQFAVQIIRCDACWDFFSSVQIVRGFNGIRHNIISINTKSTHSTNDLSRS